MLIALTIDVTAHGATVGAESVLARWPFTGGGDVTAVTWSPALQRVRRSHSTAAPPACLSVTRKSNCAQ